MWYIIIDLDDLNDVAFEIADQIRNDEDWIEKLKEIIIEQLMYCCYK